jgi:hypothetical protein
VDSNVPLHLEHELTARALLQASPRLQQVGGPGCCSCKTAALHAWQAPTHSYSHLILIPWTPIPGLPACPAPDAPPATHRHTCLAAVNAAGVYEPGWSPEQMLSDMCALQVAAEGLVAAPRSSPNARDGPRGGAAGLRLTDQQRLVCSPTQGHTERPTSSINHCLASPACSSRPDCVGPGGAAGRRPGHPRRHPAARGAQELPVRLAGQPRVAGAQELAQEGRCAGWLLVQCVA